jgi:hypothetical protein
MLHQVGTLFVFLGSLSYSFIGDCKRKPIEVDAKKTQ